ncbi:MAG: type II toxin-antitoxin system RelE/ParE family toxin [Candidatus Wallbacteria bacterium]|nr:type II toxin-antitoxin system RelE/ParE family toxin [Candidatus Wallbacteria bacterium]
MRPVSGEDGIFRLRVGRYRILFSREEDNIILIFRVGPRGDVYK